MDKGAQPLDLEGCRVAVCGAGATGLALVRALRERGAQVLVSDSRPLEQLGDSARALQAWGVPLRAGGHAAETLAQADLVVLSPGVSVDHPALVPVRARGIPIWSEIELAYRLTHARLIGITGTKGKTTTAALVSEMLNAPLANAATAGPVGQPVIGFVGPQEAPTLVVEITSYQLEAIESFRPDVGTLLNIAEDHVERHPTRESYVRAKAGIFRYQTASDVAVFNADDETVRHLGQASPARPVTFSLTQPQAVGVWTQDAGLLARFPEFWGPDPREVLRLEKLARPLQSQRYSLVAATATALAAGGSLERVRTVLQTFPGLPHRMEWVGSWQGLHFVNDSAATNPFATQAALAQSPGPVVLIAGGVTKGNDLTPLVGPFAALRALVLIGQATAALAALAETAGVPRVERAEDLEQAVRQAIALAQPGDTILLSPACASQDLFRDFAQRGEVFKAAVRAWAKEKVDGSR